MSQLSGKTLLSMMAGALPFALLVALTLFFLGAPPRLLVMGVMAAFGLAGAFELAFLRDVRGAGMLSAVLAVIGVGLALSTCAEWQEYLSSPGEDPRPRPEAMTTAPSPRDAPDGPATAVGGAEREETTPAAEPPSPVSGEEGSAADTGAAAPAPSATVPPPGLGVPTTLVVRNEGAIAVELTIRTTDGADGPVRIAPGTEALVTVAAAEAADARVVWRGDGIGGTISWAEAVSAPDGVLRIAPPGP